MAKLETRINRGIRCLDAHLPTWRERVNVDRLDMSSSTDGLIEQLFGAYYPGLVQLGLRFAGGTEYGFNILTDDEGTNEESWAELTQAWLKVLKPS